MAQDVPETLTSLSIEQILLNPDQPRRRFREESIQQLAQSIRTQGVIQPLIVRPSPTLSGFYELVAGERRWRAVQLTGQTEVPVVVRDIRDEDLMEVALLENIQRENLTPIEEAICYQDLLNRHGYTQEHLAQRIGKDRSTIANLMRLLQLPSAIQNDLEESRLTVGHARSLLALPSETERLYAREQILKHNWSVRQTEKSVKTWLDQASVEPKKKQQPSNSPSSDALKHQIQALETELQHQLQTKVSIQHSPNGKGTIKLEYYSLDEFERLYDLLKSS